MPILGFLAKKQIGQTIKSIALGVVDTIPFVSTIKANVDSTGGGKGKIDWIRALIALVPLILLFAFLFKVIDMETLKELLKMF